RRCSGGFALEKNPRAKTIPQGPRQRLIRTKWCPFTRRLERAFEVGCSAKSGGLLGTKHPSPASYGCPGSRRMLEKIERRDSPGAVPWDPWQGASPSLWAVGTNRPGDP